MERNGHSTTNDAIEDEVDAEHVTRAYQTEIMEQAKLENLIVCLPTGSGKTFIAVMLIKELSPITDKKLDEGGKRTILLTKTIELARQHHKTMTAHFDEKKIGLHTGTSSIRLPDIKRWQTEFENHSVLIFTVQIFLNILAHNIFSMDKVNLLIFDECHHATGNDPYATIMKNHYLPGPNSPRILGLTASISAQKIEWDKLSKAARELEVIFHARIETGSDQSEIVRHSTAVTVKEPRCFTFRQKVCSKDKAMMNIFKAVEALRDELDVKKDNPKENSAFSPQQKNRVLDQLKSNLNNVLSVGDDLGLYGLSRAIQALQTHVKSPNTLMTIIDPAEQDLHKRIVEKLDCLIQDHLTNLPDNRQIRFSDKVLQVEKYIRENHSDQTIVFVERVYTAKFLCQVLREIFGKSITIEYLSGSKAGLNNENFVVREQRKIATLFRKEEIQVLVATAVIEEGLDVPQCNLVIRFNKPNNFSSYMQSKGRARVKGGKALFVLFRDEDDLAIRSKNSEEYENYELMEKMLRSNFKANFYEDTSSDDDAESLPLYRPTPGVKIDGIHAIRIVYQYCATLTESETLLPQFHFCLNQSGKFECTLSMPGNSRIRDYIMCENKNKRLAKQECCLKMVHELYKTKELDENTCLPKSNRLSNGEGQNLGNMDPTEASAQTFDKQIVHFPPQSDHSSTPWYLYRVHQADNNDLGFVVPCQLFQLPSFILYGTGCEFPVEITYVKPVDLQPIKDPLQAFSRYIFEEVFEHMNTKSPSDLNFDIEHSTFQLLPCLLTESNEIDRDRIVTMCNRKRQLIRNPAELNDEEVYISLNHTEKEFFVNISDQSLPKCASDLLEFEGEPSPNSGQYKRKLPDTVETYADYHEYKRPDISIRRDFLMAAVKSFKKPRTNYLRDSLEIDRAKRITSLVTKPIYFPIEILRYAPLNQRDFELIYKLPTILIRICQLTYIEQLRKLFTENIPSHLSSDDNRMPTVTFRDCLKDILAPNQSTILPLVSFDYCSILTNRSQPQSQLQDGLIFQAITRRSAGEFTDMENLEILGDCFLKFSMCMALYHQCPRENAGKLTRQKDWLVSNKHLYQLATKKNLKSYISAQAVQYSGKERNWIPPGYTITGEHADRYLKQRCKQKAFSDMTEALIGVFLISTDYSTTIQFMDWLGLGAIPKNGQTPIMTTPSILYSDLFENNDDIVRQIEQFFVDRKFADVEQKINYTFKNKAYLIAAFTHPSYSNNNRLTQCYDRLEYLGDAVLDFLLIRSVFVDHYKYVTPSQVTSIRHDLSNNGRLAYFLVSLGLHTYILHLSAEFFYRMGSYVKDETLFSSDSSLKKSTIDQWADSTAPKTLADVFEALVGAMFLDSGYSLSTVWVFIESLLGDYIKQSVRDPNLNPIRSFYERKGEFFKVEKDDEGYTLRHARLPTGEEFIGRGKNLKLAKFDACRKAMESQKKKD